MNCDVAQGQFFSLPVSSEDFMTVLSKQG